MWRDISYYGNVIVLVGGLLVELLVNILQALFDQGRDGRANAR